MKCCVLGCGRWGSFVSWYLDKIGHAVILWGRESSEKMKELKDYRKNSYVSIPNSIKLTTNLENAISNSDYLFIAIQGQNLDSFMKDLSSCNLKNKNIILCMKGVDNLTGRRFSEIASDYVSKENIAIWAGPGQPQDLTKGIKNIMLIDSYNKKLSEHLVHELQSELINFQIGNDVIGTEIASAFKNIIGIAGGILDELGYSPLKGPLIVYGTKEISKLISAMSGKPESAYGLCCLGDYEASLFSTHSNSVKLGKSLVKKEGFNLHAPGFYTAKAINILMEKYNLNLPICSAVYEIIYNNSSAEAQVKKLLNILKI